MSSAFAWSRRLVPARCCPRLFCSRQYIAQDPLAPAPSPQEVAQRILHSLADRSALASVPRDKPHAAAAVAQRTVQTALAQVTLPTVISTQQLPDLFDRCAVRRHRGSDAALVYLLRDVHELCIPLFEEYRSHQASLRLAATASALTLRGSASSASSFRGTRVGGHPAPQDSAAQRSGSGPLRTQDAHSPESDTDSDAEEHMYDDGTTDLSAFKAALAKAAAAADAGMPFGVSALAEAVRREHKATPVAVTVQRRFQAEADAVEAAKAEAALREGRFRRRGARDVSPGVDLRKAASTRVAPATGGAASPSGDTAKSGSVTGDASVEEGVNVFVDSEDDEADSDDRALPGLYQRLFSRTVLGALLDRHTHMQDVFDSYADIKLESGQRAMSWVGLQAFAVATTILPGVVEEATLVMLHAQTCKPPQVHFEGYKQALDREAEEAAARQAAAKAAGNFTRGFTALPQQGALHSEQGRQGSDSASTLSASAKRASPLEVARSLDPTDLPPLSLPQFQELLTRLADLLHVEVLQAHMTAKQVAVYQRLRRLHSIHTPSFVHQALAASDVAAAAEREAARKRSSAQYGRAAFGGGGGRDASRDGSLPAKPEPLKVPTEGLSTRTPLSDKVNLLLDFLGFVGFDVPLDTFKTAGVTGSDALSVVADKLKPSLGPIADARPSSPAVLASEDEDAVTQQAGMGALVRADLTSGSGARRPLTAASATTTVLSDAATAMRLVALAADFAVAEVTAARPGSARKRAGGDKNIFQSIGISAGPAPLKEVVPPPKRRVKKKPGAQGASRSGSKSTTSAARPEDEDDRLDNLVWEPEEEALRTEYRRDRQRLLAQYTDDEVTEAFGQHKAKKAPKKKAKPVAGGKRKPVKLKKLKFLETGALRDRYGALLPRKASDLPKAAVLHFVATAAGLPGSSAGHDAADDNSRAATKARKDRARRYGAAMAAYKKEMKAYLEAKEVVDEENAKIRKRFKFKPESMPPLMPEPPRPSTPERPPTPPPPEHQLPSFYTMLAPPTRATDAIRGDGPVGGLIGSLAAGPSTAGTDDKWNPKSASLGTVLAEQKAALEALHSNAVGKRRTAKVKREIAALKELIKGIKAGTAEAPVGPNGKPIDLPSNPNSLLKPKADPAATAGGAGAGQGTGETAAKGKSSAKPAPPSTPANIVASVAALAPGAGVARYRPAFDARHVQVASSTSDSAKKLHPVHKRAFGGHLAAHVDQRAWVGVGRPSTAPGSSAAFPPLGATSGTVAGTGSGSGPAPRLFVSNRPGSLASPIRGGTASGTARTPQSPWHGQQHGTARSSRGATPLLTARRVVQQESKRGAGQSAPSIAVHSLADLVVQRLTQASSDDAAPKRGSSDPILAATQRLGDQLAGLRSELAALDVGDSTAAAGSLVTDILSASMGSGVPQPGVGSGGSMSGSAAVAALDARFHPPQHSLAPRVRAAYQAVGMSPLVGGGGGDDSARSGANPRLVKLAQPSGVLDLAEGIVTTLQEGEESEAICGGAEPSPAYFKVPTGTAAAAAAISSERVVKTGVVDTVSSLGLPPAARQAALLKVTAVKKTGKKRAVVKPGGDGYKRLLPRTFPGQEYQIPQDPTLGSTPVRDAGSAGSALCGLSSLSVISAPSQLVTPTARVLRAQEAAAARQPGAVPTVLPVPSVPLPPDLAPQLLREVEEFHEAQGGAPRPPQQAVIDFAAAEQYHDSGRFQDAVEAYKRAMHAWINSRELKLQQLSVGASTSAAWETPAAVAALLHARIGNVYLSAGNASDALRYLLIANDTARSLDPQHPIVPLVHARLGEALVAIGKVKLAAQCYASAVSSRTSSLGPGHRSTLTVKANLACVLLLGGQVSDGVTLLRMCVEDLRSALGAEHPRVTTMQRNFEKAQRHAGALSQSYAGLGRRPTTLGLRPAEELGHLLTDAKWKADQRPPAVDPFKRVKGKRGKKRRK